MADITDIKSIVYTEKTIELQENGVIVIQTTPRMTKNSLKEVFKEYQNLPKLTSTKSLTGHSLGATGVQEAIYTLIMMNNNFISGSSNIQNDDPDIGSIEIPRKTIQNIDINLALSNSFGFGGTNACLALSKFN